MKKATASAVRSNFAVPFLTLVLVATLGVSTTQQAATAQPQKAQQIRVVGRIQEDGTAKPIKSASVYMKNLGDGSATGDLADSAGRFSINNAKAGRYHIAVSYLGFAKYKDTIVVDAGKQQMDVGTIKLQASATQLGAVDVTAERETMEITPEKKVFNVGKNSTVTGGTAADVLKQVPTVDVDVDGNISVRGSSNLVIQINGKQSGFAGTDRAALLQQIPANLIDKVEVITNPSARYDAEGMAGIINIVTKTAITQSWNLTAIAGVGTNDKYNASLDFAYKSGPLSMSVGYGARVNHSYFGGGVNLERLYGNYEREEQTLANRASGVGNFGNFNIDYSLPDNITLNLTGQARTNQGKNNEDIITQHIFSNGELYRSTSRNNTTERGWMSGDVGGGFKQTYSSPQHYLDISTRYSYNRQNSQGHFIEQENELSGQPKTIMPITQNNNFVNQFRIWTMQADYVQPTSIGKVETGLKSTMRVIDNDVYLDSLNRTTLEYIPDNRSINRFAYNDLVLAAYGVLGTKLFGFDVQAGLRIEHTRVNTQLFATDARTSINYTHFFPTLHVSNKLDSTSTLQLSYSRRINRPNFWQLNPFTDYSNPTILRKGNPNLLPETIDAAEVSYIAQLDQHTLTATAYYRRTNNAMQFKPVVDTVTNVATLTFINLNSIENKGLEFIYRGQLYKWWTATVNLNLFHNSLQGGSETGAVSAGRVTYNVRLMSSFKMPWDGGNLQMNYMYNGPSLMAAGSMEAWQSITLGFRQDLSREWSVGFNVSDVLNTQRFNLALGDNTYLGTAHQKPETRIATLNLTFRIGAMQGEQPRRRRDNGDVQEGGGFGL